MFEAEISRLPVNPPRDPALLPGLALNAAWLRRYSGILVIAGLMVLMPAVVFLNDPGARLELRGRRVEAVVTSVTESANPGSGVCRVVAYSFSISSGGEYRGSCRCARGSPYFEAKVGDHVPVRYLPSNPWSNELDGNNQGPPIVLIAIIPLFFLGAFSPLWWPFLKNWLHARKVFKNGRIAKGEIVFVKRASPSWPSYVAAPSDLHIAFREPTGEMVEASAVCSNDWLLSHLPPGAEVNIAYMPDDPKKAVLLDEFIR